VICLSGQDSSNGKSVAVPSLRPRTHRRVSVVFISMVMTEMRPRLYLLPLLWRHWPLVYPHLEIFQGRELEDTNYVRRKLQCCEYDLLAGRLFNMLPNVVRRFLSTIAGDLSRYGEWGQKGPDKVGIGYTDERTVAKSVQC